MSTATDDRAVVLATELAQALKQLLTDDHAQAGAALQTLETLTREQPRAATVAMYTAVHALAVHLAVLRARIVTLEALPRALAYQGVWREGATFEKHDVVTSDGSVWICLRPTTAKPGTDDGQSWHMMLRRARDGRDRRG